MHFGLMLEPLVCRSLLIIPNLQPELAFVSIESVDLIYLMYAHTFVGSLLIRTIIIIYYYYYYLLLFITIYYYYYYLLLLLSLRRLPIVSTLRPRLCFHWSVKLLLNG